MFHYFLSARFSPDLDIMMNICFTTDLYFMKNVILPCTWYFAHHCIMWLLSEHNKMHCKLEKYVQCNSIVFKCDCTCTFEEHKIVTLCHLGRNKSICLISIVMSVPIESINTGRIEMTPYIRMLHNSVECRPIHPKLHSFT